jgi:putative protease
METVTSRPPAVVGDVSALRLPPRATLQGVGLELLAPARDADHGILALRCGADAVYMGGPRFGARATAGCNVADFERVCSEARLWGAKVYATLNTILFDHELDEALSPPPAEGPTSATITGTLAPLVSGG